VSRGAPALRQLTAGASVGVVVDAAPIVAATRAQQELLGATEATVSAMREQNAAAASFDTSPMSDAAEVAQLLADAERKAATAAQDASGAFIRSWKAQQDAAGQASAAARAVADESTRNAQTETAARETVRAAILEDIAQLRAYSATVDATSTRAVADFEQQAASVRDNARAIGLEGEQLFKLDGFIRRTSESFRVQAAEARNAARAISEQQAGPRANVTGVSGQLAAVSRQATAAKAAVAGVTFAGQVTPADHGAARPRARRRVVRARIARARRGLGVVGAPDGAPCGGQLRDVLRPRRVHRRRDRGHHRRRHRPVLQGARRGGGHAEEVLARVQVDGRGRRTSRACRANSRRSTSARSPSTTTSR
jgi:hypothetical protein